MGSQLRDQGLSLGPWALGSESSEPQPWDRWGLPQTDNVDAHILQLIPSGSPALTLRDSPRGRMAALIPAGSRTLMAGSRAEGQWPPLGEAGSLQGTFPGPLDTDPEPRC